MKPIILIDNGHGSENREEVWKDVPGWEGLYQVSDRGRVKSLARDYTICNVAVVHKQEALLKQHPGKFGYQLVELNYNGKAKCYPVHRLVAMAFIPNPENKPHVDHIDTITSNNSVENLRWVTPKENVNNPLTRDKRLAIEWFSGPANPLYEEKSPDSKIVLQFDKKGNFVARYPGGCHQAMRRNPGTDYSKIACVCRGERYTHKGYIWKYETDYSA